ncbi:hypothetical protein OPW19_02905 [Vibrio europaeus]|uniref:hypothetical protein n=1 Tax=Vibrio europaeus TaxID=300876 RepID=UPI00233F4A67|nr:hypothetical protein [Vibrio europaeus]MDC5818765.1 hypothetical protein [Vibrio europaeus]MDC5871211.1 hypothetical protein [Vibrio europaeus]
MKVSRFKAIPFLIVIGLMAFLTLDETLNVMNYMTNDEKRVTINGALNDASALAGFVIFGSSFALFFIGFVTGRDLRWVPKIIFMMIGGGALAAFLVGWQINGSVKHELAQKGYIECVELQQLTLKSSSRTYVLPSQSCE